MSIGVSGTLVASQLFLRPLPTSEFQCVAERVATFLGVSMLISLPPPPRPSRFHTTSPPPPRPSRLHPTPPLPPPLPPRHAHLASTPPLHPHHAYLASTPLLYLHHAHLASTPSLPPSSPPHIFLLQIHPTTFSF